MSLIIDGYNLLHVTGFVGDGSGRSLQRCRELLLNFLTVSLDEPQRVQTTIVFDAADAPSGLPRLVKHQGITVRYAAEYSDADALIEKLIRENDAPRSLLVVSSDHRIQRAARRRRASWVDSDRWYSDIWKERLAKQRTAEGTLFEKPVMEMTADEIDYWVARFTSADTATGEEGEPSPTDVADGSTLDPLNPFPPRFGEDLTQ